MKRLFPLLILAISLASCADKHNLQLNLIEGETYIQTQNIKSSIKQEVNGQNVNMEMTSMGKLGFRVVKKYEDYYDIKARFQSLHLTMSSIYGSMDFNSEDTDTSNIFASLLGKLTDEEFTVEMNPNGTIRGIDGLDALFANMMNDFPEVPEMQKKQMITQLRQSYGDDVIKGNFEMTTAIFPDKNVAINEKWNNSVELSTSMPIKVNNEFTLSSYDEQYANIEANSTIDNINADQYTDINGVEAKYDLKGGQKATIKIDSKTGWVVDATITQNLKGDVSLKGNPALPEGMTVPMEVTNTMTISNK